MHYFWTDITSAYEFCDIVFVFIVSGHISQPFIRFCIPGGWWWVINDGNSKSRQIKEGENTVKTRIYKILQCSRLEVPGRKA